MGLLQCNCLCEFASTLTLKNISFEWFSLEKLLFVHEQQIDVLDFGEYFAKYKSTQIAVDVCVGKR